MAIRSLTYLDIPAGKRKDSASKIINKVREQLNDPLTTVEQAQKLQDRLILLEQWANGSIPTERP